MLQQTQVATVIPYYEAFLDQFPNVEALAAAPIDEVLARWSGLGYYRRARQLHAAACRLVEDGRAVPRTAAELRELPGIGDYTAAAIASIAFDEAVAVVDGNVERVICRLLAYTGDPKRAEGRRHVRSVATELLDPDQPGESNQAIMELGATVCRPKAPTCLVCPLASGCRGKASPEDYPPPRRRRETEKVDLAVALVHRGDRVLLLRRAVEDEIMPGMWELPHAPRHRSRVRQAAAWAERYGGSWTVEGPVEHTVRHAITHRAITFHVHAAELVDDRELIIESSWITETNRSDYAVSSAVSKVLARVLGWS